MRATTPSYIRKESMPREITMHLHVIVPEDDGRSTPELVAVVESKLKASTVKEAARAHKELDGLTLEIVAAEPFVPESDEPVIHYTVHPFDDEWTWDNNMSVTGPTSGSHPWTTKSLAEAIDHANLVRLEYASVEGADPDWIAGFWSAIYGEGEDVDMIGYVDPLGNFTFGSEPPLDDEGGWKGDDDASVG